MNQTDDRHSAPGAEDDRGFDPQAAAALLEQTTRQARRQFDPRPPLLLAAGAPVWLFAYGAAWWSVRDQHPYVGPSGAALGIIYTSVIVWAVAAGSAFQRAATGVGGRSKRRRQIEGAAFASAWIAVYVFMGALEHAGASKAIVYGIYPASAPLIFVGAAAAANAAAHEAWSRVLPLIALVGIACGAAYAGPRAAWLVAGAGVCVVLLALSGTQFWLRRA